MAKNESIPIDERVRSIVSGAGWLELVLFSLFSKKAALAPQDTATETQDEPEGGAGSGTGEDPGDAGGPTIFGEEIDDPIYCGPESSAWFGREVHLYMVFASAMNRKAIAWGTADFRARPWILFFVPRRVYIKSWQYAILAVIGMQLTYEGNSTFRSQAGLCPMNCDDTLTVCGGCIHRSEVGNFIYGVIARYLQMTWLQTFLGAWAGNRGAWTNSDRAAVELGWDFIDQGNRNGGAVCGFFQGNAVDWRAMQEDGGGCPPCPQSVVPGGQFHSTLPNPAALNRNSPLPVNVPPQVIGQP